MEWDRGDVCLCQKAKLENECPGLDSWNGKYLRGSGGRSRCLSDGTRTVTGMEPSSPVLHFSFHDPTEWRLPCAFGLWTMLLELGALGNRGN